MARSFFVLALNGFREAIRNRVTVLVALFAIGLLLSSSLITAVTVATFSRVLTDVGLGVMTLLLVVLAVFLSTGQVTREIERRTIFLVVSKPISRGLFIWGRLAGNMMTLTVLLAGMAAAFCIELALYGAPITQAQLTAMGMLWMELLVLSSLGMLLASFSTQVVATLVTISLFFAGHLSGDVYALADKARSPALQLVGKACYYVLPNLSRLSFRTQASYDLPSSPSQVLNSCAYGAAYSVVVVTLAVLIFNRRDFK